MPVEQDKNIQSHLERRRICAVTFDLDGEKVLAFISRPQIGLSEEMYVYVNINPDGSSERDADFHVPVKLLKSIELAQTGLEEFRRVNSAAITAFSTFFENGEEPSETTEQSVSESRDLVVGQTYVVSSLDNPHNTRKVTFRGFHGDGNRVVICFALDTRTNILLIRDRNAWEIKIT